MFRTVTATLVQWVAVGVLGLVQGACFADTPKSGEALKSSVAPQKTSTAQQSGTPGQKPHAAKPERIKPDDPQPEPDLSGKERHGKASFYAKMFEGRQMANGEPMDPNGNNAASLTLPLGTTAKVTNVETGKSAVVTIKDRGPYVKGRIVDLSPSTARKIGITERKGVARVAVAPIEVHLPDGRIKVGVAAEADHAIALR